VAGAAKACVCSCCVCSVWCGTQEALPLSTAIQLCNVVSSKTPTTTTCGWDMYAMLL
jgi:hypothetical protein